MFADLTERQVQRTKPWWYHSFPIGVHAMTTATDVLDYLCSAEVEDYKGWGLEKLNPYNGDDFPAYCELFQRPEFGHLKIRFLARLTSYVTTICYLDGILEESYRRFLEDLPKLGHGVLVPTDKGAAEMHKREDEIKSYSFYRNKVFAHTSFEMPRYGRSTDSQSMQFTSLFFLSGVPLIMRENCIALGGVSVQADVREVIPLITIVQGHPDVTKHYASWEHMFTDILKQIPREELKEKINTLEV